MPPSDTTILTNYGLLGLLAVMSAREAIKLVREQLIPWLSTKWKREQDHKEKLEEQDRQRQIRLEERQIQIQDRQVVAIEHMAANMKEVSVQMVGMNHRLDGMDHRLEGIESDVDTIADHTRVQRPSRRSRPLSSGD